MEEIIHSNARVADLVGLLSVLVNTFKGRTDLYELEKETEVDLDDLMPIVYTANYLGFVTIGEGDIVISDKGQEFLKASMKRRKEMIRSSVVRVEPFRTATQLKRSPSKCSWIHSYLREFNSTTAPQEVTSWRLP